MLNPQTHQDLMTILGAMKKAHLAHGHVNAATRKDRLQRAAKLITDNHDQLVKAMSADFGNCSHYQSLAADILTTTNMLRHSAEQLEGWMQAEPVASPYHGMQSWIQHQALGVVGIISPWNFPVNLAFGPLAGVFAAGNSALIKPSELTPRTSEVLAELIARYFDPMELGVVLGDASVGAAFSALPFDHLVFTGSTTVGRHVMKAAAENLVPVTLELGGKSPVVIEENADISLAAERVMTVKTFNAGQICLAPDYVLIRDDKADAFVAAAKSLIANSYPEIQTNKDYTSIVNERHFQRLIGLIQDAKDKGARIVSLAPEGEPDYDIITGKIAPHLILNANDSMAVMQEEIFGPILPLVAADSVNDAIRFINARPRPLAAYYFGNDTEKQNHFAEKTTSGALVINDVMSHASVEALPFGGVGASGIGAYHGRHGFRQVTHAKAVVRQSEDGASNLRLRAPYEEKIGAATALLNGNK